MISPHLKSSTHPTGEQRPVPNVLAATARHGGWRLRKNPDKEQNKMKNAGVVGGLVCEGVDMRRTPFEMLP